MLGACLRHDGWGLAVSLLAWVTAAMLALAPGRDHSALARAITHVVETEGCLYVARECERRTAAMLIGIAFRESTFRLDAVGDGGKSKCAYQIWRGSDSLLTDANACTLAGYRRVKESLQRCGTLAGFASGSCTNKAGLRIDADRKRLALRILEGR